MDITIKSNFEISGLKPLTLVMSIILHLLLFPAFYATINSPEITNSIVELDLINTETSIVSESQAPEKKVDTNRLSAKDSATEKEQIKKGVPQPQIQKSTPVKQQAQPKSAQSKQSQAAVNNKSESVNENKSIAKNNVDNANLLLSQNDLSKFTNKSLAKASDSQRSSRLNTYEPFRQNRLFENSGSADYLPKVSEGQITLLNAKADQYAVFVRRVALQVFSQLRAKNWAQLGFAQARQSKRFATIEAVMNKQGKLTSFKLLETSSSDGFDKVLQNSVQSGLWDQNPPANAALEDGNIHFIFKARTWAEIVGDPGRERRWLLLATGLK